MKMFQSAVVFAVLLGFYPAVAQCEDTSNRPSILIIKADDLGYRNLGCYGCKDTWIFTRHIDSLAAEGMKFTNAYVTDSMCGPSRAGFITGHFLDASSDAGGGDHNTVVWFLSDHGCMIKNSDNRPLRWLAVMSIQRYCMEST